MILIGEIRDRETMQAAIDLAGTGHLAIATLHANNSPETLDRIINMYPNDQHKQVLMDLAQYVRVIISQRLVRSKEGKRGRGGRGHAEYAAHPRDDLEGRHQLGEGSVQGTRKSLGCRASIRRCSICSGAVRSAWTRALSNADSRSNLEAKINFS